MKYGEEAVYALLDLLNEHDVSSITFENGARNLSCLNRSRRPSLAPHLIETLPDHRSIMNLPPIIFLWAVQINV